MKSVLKYNKKHQRVLIRGNSVQSLNTRELSVISDRRFPGIMKLEVIKDTLPVCLSISTEGFTTLTEYLKTVVVTKRLFCYIVREIIKSIRNADRFKFSHSLFVYNTDYVFIAKHSLLVALTYIPLQPYSSEEKLPDLLNQIVRKAVFDMDDGTEYLKKFITITKDCNFSMYILEEYLSSLEKETVPQSKSYESGSRLGNGTKDSEPCGSDINQSAVKDNKGVNDIVAEQIKLFRIPTQDGFSLYCKQTGQCTAIGIVPFLIGRKQSDADLVIENASISRKQAEIIKYKTNYYIIDLNSRNGTFVNGCFVHPGDKKLLHENDVISFAGLQYVFQKNGGK